MRNHRYHSTALLLIIFSGLAPAQEVKQAGKVRWSYDIRKDGNQTSFHGDALIADDLVVIVTDGGLGHVSVFEAARCTPSKRAKVRPRCGVRRRGVDWLERWKGESSTRPEKP